MRATKHSRRLGPALLAAVLLPLAGSGAQTDDTTVAVPGAKIAYMAPGTWEKSEPHEAMSVCAPFLRSPDGTATISVEVFPNARNKAWDLAHLKELAENYAATLLETKGAIECAVTTFDSDQHVAGYNVHYLGVPNHLSASGATFQNSIYFFTNRSDNVVCLTYTTTAGHFSAETDSLLRKTIALSDQ